MGAKKLLSLFLVLVLCLGIIPTAYAANDRGVAFSATLDTPTLQTSDQAQTVTLTITANQSITLASLGATIVKDSPLVLESVVSGNDKVVFGTSDIVLGTGKVSYFTPDTEDVEIDAGASIIKATFIVPAQISAGTYMVGLENLEIADKIYTSDAPWETDGVVSTVLTVIPSTDGYTAGVSKVSDGSVGEQVTVNVNVNHSEDDVFAAGEIGISYDSTKLEYVGVAPNTVSVNAGTAGELKLADYGVDKAFGNAVYALTFNAIADGEAVVEISSAAFSNKENAVARDLIEATLAPESVTVTIDKREYTVTLPDIFDGPETATEGEAYTFTATDSDNYTYDEVKATVNGEPVTVTDNGDGSYTIDNVTGELVITGVRTPKSYDVTVEGDEDNDVEAADKATYGEAYSFKLNQDEGYGYDITIKINDMLFTDYSISDSVWTIPGSAITGNIVIIVEKNQTEAKVEIEGDAGVADENASEAVIGEEYVLTIKPEAGYTYEVTATMGGEQVDLIFDEENNTYTIETVTGNIKFNIVRTVIVDNVTIHQYLTLNGNNMWLILQDVELAEGKVATYADDQMFWSDIYDAYCYLVIEENLMLEDAKQVIDIAEGDVVSVDYGMDVNKTNKVDANDAQLVYNMYMAAHENFDTISMEKFLRADVAGDDKAVDVKDAAAIIQFVIA